VHNNAAHCTTEFRKSPARIFVDLLPLRFQFNVHATCIVCRNRIYPTTYTHEWKAMVTEKYGSAPDIFYAEAPVSVDNIVNVIEPT
jgi:hypothetical protein